MASFSSIDVSQQREWLAALRLGRLDAFRALFDAYTPRLCRFAQLSVPTDVAEDVVQDVLFDLWERRTSLALRDGELTPYLFGAVRNKILQYNRHQRVVERTESLGDEQDVPGMGAPTPPTDAPLLAHDAEMRLMALLAQLTELQRAVLALRWTHGLTYDQAAQTLGISAQAARQHASRAGRLLRPLLDRLLSG